MPKKNKLKFGESAIFHPNYREKEIQKMVESIYQDGEDKVMELDVIADENYNRELYNILRTSIMQIDNRYRVTEENVATADSWRKSYLELRSMLDLMTAQYNLIVSVLHETESRLVKISKSQSAFNTVTRALLLQALIQIMEKEVKCTVRRSDHDRMNDAISWGEKNFKQITGSQVKVFLNDDVFLDDDVYGGVVITSMDDTIRVDNTLKQRFNNMRQKAGSLARLFLFGSLRQQKQEEAKLEAKSELLTDSRPESKSELRPGSKSELESESEPKPGSRSESRSESRPGSTSEPKSDSKTETGSASGSRPGSKSETKSEPKSDSNPDS